MRAILPWLAEEEPELYNLYQSTHGPRVEASVKRAERIASFIGHEPRRALLVGLFDQAGAKRVTLRACAEHHGFQRLIALGMDRSEEVLDDEVLLFDLRPSQLLSEWKGRLTVEWPGSDRAWYRWADPERNRFPLVAIPSESALVRDMPEWEKLVLSWAQLQVLPASWRERLAQWRGVYLIHDLDDGRNYVGSAGGQDNLLGRWLNYAVSGHAGNALLRGRDPSGFRFSILQRLSPDLPIDQINAVENSWKERLHTRGPHGLNAN